MYVINVDAKNPRPRTNSLSPERLRRATPSPSFPSRYFDHDGDDDEDGDNDDFFLQPTLHTSSGQVQGGL